MFMKIRSKEVETLKPSKQSKPKYVKSKPTAVSKAMAVVTKAIRNDPGYFIAWQANIAMSFVDQVAWDGHYVSAEKIHASANKAAIKFLALLCNKPNCKNINTTKLIKEFEADCLRHKMNESQAKNKNPLVSKKKK